MDKIEHIKLKHYGCQDRMKRERKFYGKVATNEDINRHRL